MVTQAILFDMDGTLYKSQAIRTKFAEAAYYTLAKEKSISLDSARQSIEQKRDSMKVHYGQSVPYTLTLQSLGIPIAVWHEYNIDYFDPGEYLKSDPLLEKSLKILKAHFTLAVITNNNHIQTQRTLKAIGVNGFFDSVFTYNSYHILKPDPAFFMRAAEDLKVAINACCCVGDRYDIDLKPAKAIGMSVLEVQGPEDIYDLPHRFLQGDQTV